MNDQVGIAANGRSEMRVLVKAKSEVAERFGGVAGLLEGTQHQIGKDAFFGLAGKFFDQPLIMLRRDGDFRAGEGDALLAFAALAVGIGASGVAGAGTFPWRTVTSR